MTKTEFNNYLKSFEQKLKSVFYERADINEFSQKRGFPAMVLREIMSHNPLSFAVPKAYGGQGISVRENLAIMSAASYESLPLSLTMGINIALFMQPVAKYADDAVKSEVFHRFIHKQNMGGLMITEPNFGSDALNMQTSHVESDGLAHIQGKKHWQGLTGMADFWLITSRRKNEDGRLNRDIDFYVCDVTKPNQQVVVEEYFDNLGLYAIPYGLNKLDLKIPTQYKLKPESTGIKMMLDILHRSRMHFPGMAMGFIKRMLDEALTHCKNRIVGNGSLLELDQVKHQIAKIQSAFTITSAMCHRSSGRAGVDVDLAAEGIEANSMKTVVTDLMQESAQTLVQLSGAKGYRISHIGGRGIVDSRPFQIFEGANEMLYSQISEMVIKLMKRKKEFNLFQFLNSFGLTGKVAELFKEDINFSINLGLQQRKLVDLGKALGRIICAEFVIDLGESGFRKDLIASCLTSIKQDVAERFSSFNFKTTIVAVEDYNDNSSWMDLS